MSRRPAMIVTRTARRSGDTFSYFDNGKPIPMAPAIALQGARRGAVKLRTKGDRPCKR